MSDLLKYDIKNAYIPEKMENSSYLEILLENGETAFVNEFEEWNRLNSYCDNFKTSIVTISIRFRDHIELVSEGAALASSGADGHSFTKGVGGWVGSPDDQENFFIVGELFDDTIIKSWWKVPEITKKQTDRVPLELFDDKQSLIYGKAKV